MDRGKRAPELHVRLEKAANLDNMLSNKTGQPHQPACQREKMSMKKAFLALLLAASVTPAGSRNNLCGSMCPDTLPEMVVTGILTTSRRVLPG